VIADAALRRAQCDVVLHTIAGEDLDLAVVHLHGTRNDDLPLGVREDLPDAGIELEDASRLVELLKHRGKDAALFGHACVYCRPAAAKRL